MGEPTDPSSQNIDKIRGEEKFKKAVREALIHIAAEQTKDKTTEYTAEIFRMLHASKTEEMKSVFESEEGKKLGLIYPDQSTLDEEASRFYYDQLED